MKLDSFSQRLQHVARIKKIDQKDLVNGIQKAKGTVSKWWNGGIVPGAANTRVIAEFIGCDELWLQCGAGEPFPHIEIGTAEPTTNLKPIRKEKQLQDKTDRFLREKFKEKCHSFLDQHGIYDFIAENYGEDFDGMEQFVKELHASHASYRDWIEEKKQERLDHQTGPQNKLSVNGDD